MDDELLGEPGITMIRADPSDVVLLGRSTIPMISSGFTRRGAAALFTLAYNASASGEKHAEYLFSDVTEYESVGDN